MPYADKQSNIEQSKIILFYFSFLMHTQARVRTRNEKPFRIRIRYANVI